jgi:hypothetical protein
MKVINWRLVSHPLNWATVVLMVMIAGAFGHLLLEYLGIRPANEGKKSAWTEQPAGQNPGQEAAGAIDPSGSLQSPLVGV